jgi:hypothetical protein
VLALGARERVLLVRLRMQEHGEVAPDGPVTGGEHDLRRRADHHVVAIDDGTPEELVANRSTDPEYAHGAAEAPASRVQRPLSAR